MAEVMPSEPAGSSRPKNNKGNPRRVARAVAKERKAD
jgi:hypothetical protein